MTLKQTPKPKFDTLTTAGRLAKAAYNRQLHQKQSTPPTTKMASTPPPPPKKKRKITHLPPPAEIEAEAKRKAEAKLKPKKKAKTPLTTEEKIAATKAKAKKRGQAVEFDGTGLKVVESGLSSEVQEKKDGRKTKKIPGVKPRNLMDFMKDFGQMNSYVPRKKGMSGGGGGEKGGDRKQRESVLDRPTERTKRLKAEMEKARTSGSNEKAVVIKIEESGDTVEIKTEEGSDPITTDPEESRKSRLSIMGLPLELRQRIWSLVVVEEQYFVYPGASTEQPDLAMTTRQIRTEVLPIYYGENTFALEVSPGSPGEGLLLKEPKIMSIDQILKWAAALKSAGHIETIRNWAVSWAQPLGHQGRPRSKGPKGVQELIVSLRFPKPGVDDDEKSGIEIHREASCLLRSHHRSGQCVRMRYPSWLDEAVATDPDEEIERVKKVVRIAEEIGRRGLELVGSRCADKVIVLD